MTIDDRAASRVPPAIAAICRDTDAIGFTMGSEARTGSLLGTLAAMKPAGRFLELGTGTGIGTAWLLSGMDRAARLDSVDSDSKVQAIARLHLGGDPRVRFHHIDGAAFLAASAPDSFDLIFADAWTGKFTDLDLALGLLRTGGVYVIDDLLPQPSWPAGHAAKVPALVDQLARREGFTTTTMAWASGLMLVVKSAIGNSII